MIRRTIAIGVDRAIAFEVIGDAITVAVVRVYRVVNAVAICIKRHHGAGRAVHRGTGRIELVAVGDKNIVVGTHLQRAVVVGARDRGGCR